MFNASGGAKPGRVSPAAVTLLCDGEALVMQVPLPDELRDALNHVLADHANGMVVHGYKRQLHLC